MIKNPFNPQNPSDPEYFYGRSDVLDRFRDNVKYGLNGNPEHMALIGDFGIGKTSLLYKLHSLENPDDVTTVFVQCNAEDVETFQDFVKTIVERLSQKLSRLDIRFELSKIKFRVLEIERKDEEISVLSCIDDLEKLFQKCGSGNHLIILFVDDLHLAAHHRSDIRNCFQELNRLGCQYMLIGTLIPEVFEEGEINRPFKRMFNTHHLEEFSKQESRNMVEYIIDKADMEVSLSDDLHDKLYSETGGHPYYLTLFMNELVRGKESGKITIEDYSGREPKIIDRMKVVLDGKFDSMTQKDEEVITRIVGLDSDEFSPNDADSTSGQFQQLQKKEVLEKVGHGRYKFKYPVIRRYFSYKNQNQMPR